MGRPKEPWKRERLLDAAMTTVVDKGFGSLTVKDVASAAGVSTGTVHYHFSDIDGVLLGVVERALDQMYDQRLDAIAHVTDISQKLVTLIELGLPDEISHEVTLIYEAIPVIRSREHFRPVIKSYSDRQVSLYRSVIAPGALAEVLEQFDALGGAQGAGVASGLVPASPGSRSRRRRGAWWSSHRAPRCRS